MLQQQYQLTQETWTLLFSQLTQYSYPRQLAHVASYIMMACLPFLLPCCSYLLETTYSRYSQMSFMYLQLILCYFYRNQLFIYPKLKSPQKVAQPKPDWREWLYYLWGNLLSQLGYFKHQLPSQLASYMAIFVLHGQKFLPTQY